MSVHMVYHCYINHCNIMDISVLPSGSQTGIWGKKHLFMDDFAVKKKWFSTSMQLCTKRFTKSPICLSPSHLPQVLQELSKSIRKLCGSAWKAVEQCSHLSWPMTSSNYHSTFNFKGKSDLTKRKSYLNIVQKHSTKSIVQSSIVQQHSTTAIHEHWTTPKISKDSSIQVAVSAAFGISGLGKSRASAARINALRSRLAAMVADQTLVTQTSLVL